MQSIALYEVGDFFLSLAQLLFPHRHLSAIAWAQVGWNKELVHSEFLS